MHPDRHPRHHHAWRRRLAAVVAFGLSTVIVGSTPALAGPRYTPAAAQQEKPVPGETVKPRRTAPAPAPSFAGPAPQWPAASTVDVDLAPTAAKLRTAGTTVSVSAPTSTGLRAAAPGPAKVRVSTLDQAASKAAGVDGLLFTVRGLAGAGEAQVTVDYAKFRWAHGGDWAGRLHLVELPACALSTPEAAGCARRPVPTSNDPGAGTVTGAVTLNAAAGSTFALEAAPAGAAGTFAATSLAPSSTWSSGGSSGDFSWSYPVRSPPGLAGPVPTVNLSYSSGSVDGRVSASNNQPSWIGEGFDWQPGFIERRYRTCSDDMAGEHNNATKTGDECWATDNATLSMSGHAGELIRDAATPGRWRLRSDDGTYVEHRTGSANGARDGEFWVVTTPDGVKYWYGKTAASTMTAPVYGNHPGEPCHAAAFKDSGCTQGYRWNLEYVEDVHQNTMTYTYTKETNKYARLGTTTDLVAYDRDAYLARVDYGTRVGRTEAAPAQVVFTTGDRCLADCGTLDAKHWPDTPLDLECKASPCYVGAPTFWSKKRLTGITNRSGGKDVESWTLTQSFPDPGDGTRAGLWLDRISHVGLVGAKTPAQEVSFEWVQKSNRVDTYNDQYPAMKWMRLRTITTETGGKITVSYSDPDCVVGSRMPDPARLQDNALRCYPVYWTPDDKSTPILDYFHKYVVTDVVESDLTGGATRVLTHYDYLGDPGWHYTDDDGLIRTDSRTWSDWRGYGAVRATKGDPGEQTQAVSRYFRGLDGDHLPTGTRTVKLPAVAVGNIGEAADADALAGMTRETVTYNGPGGPEVTATVTEPWQSAPTATRTINGVTVYARFTGTAATHTRTALDGGRGFRTTTSRTGYDGYGMPDRIDDAGDDAVTGDESCALTDYARNPGAWLTTLTSRQRTFAVSCQRATSGAALTDAQVVDDTQTDYDNQANGVAPVKGEPTGTRKMRIYNAGAPTYVTTSTSTFDAYGRAVLTTDIKGNSSRIALTPAAGGPVTQTVATDAMGWQTTTTLEPAWGAPLTTVDSNKRKTEMEYDGMGRLLRVWQPGRDRTTQSPNVTYDYLIRSDGAVAVQTRKLNAAGGYVSLYTLYDSMLRPRQTQSPNGTGGAGMIVTDTFYDSAGRAKASNGMYLAAGTPGPNLFKPSVAVPNRGETVYDGAGRVTASILLINGTERSRSGSGYGGDRLDLFPPAGGVATSTVVDAAGQTVELRQYHAGVRAGTADPAGYDATRYEYDAKGQQVRTIDPVGNHWDYEYDLWGRKVRTTDPDRGVTSMVLNDGGEVVTTTDARQVTLGYTYDRIGRRTSVRDGSPTGPLRSSIEYDTLASGEAVNGQPVKSTRYVGADAFVTETLGFTFDYQPTSVRHTIPTAGVGGTYTYVFTYNQDGSPYTQRMPAAGDLSTETLTFGYDALGQPTTLDSGYGTAVKTSLVASTGYTSYSEVGTYNLRNNGGNAVDVTRHYEDGTRRIDQIWTTKQTAPTTVSDVRYSYDQVGDVTAISDLTSGDNQCFRTDHLRRLTEAWTPAARDCAAAPTAATLGGPAKYWQSFSLDVLGNRTAQVEHATATGDRTTTYTPVAGRHALESTSTVDSTGTRTGSYTYDNSGNTHTRPTPASGTQTLEWDAEGHEKSSSDSTGDTSYVYDADGSRLLRKDPAGVTLYLPGQEIRSTTATTATGTRYYSHAGQAVATRTAAGLTWLSGDAQGTTQTTVNAVTQAVATRRSTPYGTDRGAPVGTWPASLDKGLVGGTKDNTGLTHLGAREYDPTVGRFVSADPVMDIGDPQQWQGYLYANNNPATFSDPSGTCWTMVCGALVIAEAVGTPIVKKLAGNEHVQEFVAANITLGATTIGWGVTHGIAAANATIVPAVSALTGRNAQTAVRVLGGPHELTEAMQAVRGFKKGLMGTEEDPTAFRIGWEWASDTGPRHRDLTEGQFVDTLRKHRHVVDTEEKISKGIDDGSIRSGTVNAKNRYSLAGGPDASFTDSAKHFFGDLVHNQPAALLGSYNLEYTVTGVDYERGTASVTFKVTNETTMASGTRLPPPIGYGPFYQKYHIDQLVNGSFGTGPGSSRTQTITWQTQIKVKRQPVGGGVSSGPVYSGPTGGAVGGPLRR